MRCFQLVHPHTFLCKIASTPLNKCYIMMVITGYSNYLAKVHHVATVHSLDRGNIPQKNKHSLVQTNFGYSSRQKIQESWLHYTIIGGMPAFSDMPNICFSWNCAVYYNNRAYPGSEFVVANTLAKWKNVEPNEIDFSQGFRQKVVSRSSACNSLPASGNLCHLLITFANSLDPDQALRNVGPDLDPNCLTP